MSGCERALDLIGLRLDGPLSPEEQRELDAHLEQCPACRAAARELEELEGALVQLGECDPPPQLVSGVMERVRADSAPAKVVPLWKRPAFRGALGMAACAALCIGLLPQMAGLSSGGGNSTGAAPASASESQAASSTPAAGALCCRRGVLPLCRGPLQQCGPSGSRGHRPDGGGVPRLHRSLLPAGTGAGAPEDFSALAPALSEALAGQLGQSPGRLLLVLHHSRGTGGPGLAGDGRLSLDRPGGGGGPLPAGRPDRPGRRPVGERGGGPRSGSGVSLNLTSALDRVRFVPGPGLFSAFFRGRAAFSSFLFHFTSATKKRLSDVHFYDIIANSRSPRHGGFRLGSLYESVQT